MAQALDHNAQYGRLRKGKIYFEQDGLWIHIILDPVQGKP